MAAGLTGILLLLAFTVGGAAFYFLPTIIAVVRKHRSVMAIALINTFAGWTFVGWVWPLIWSLANHGRTDVSINQTFHNGMPMNPAAQPTHNEYTSLIKPGSVFVPATVADAPTPIAPPVEEV
jgi:hypothetical protein